LALGEISRPGVIGAHHGQAHRAVFQQLGRGLLVVGRVVGHQVEGAAYAAQLRRYVGLGQASGHAPGTAVGLQCGGNAGGKFAHQQHAPLAALQGGKQRHKVLQALHIAQVHGIKLGCGGRYTRCGAEEHLSHPHVAPFAGDAIVKAQALLHPGVLKQAVLGPGLEQALELVFAPRCRWHRGRSVFMHLEGVRPALGGVARHAPADPPDDGGVLGHAVRVGVYLHLVPQTVQKFCVGHQLRQVGGTAMDVVN